MRGRLLVALPALDDPNFDRTVVYLLEHNEEGAFGLVLNRPSEDTPFGALMGWHDLLCPPESLFEGGPVQPEAFVGLAEVESEDAEGAWASIGNGLGTVDLSLDAALVAGRIGRLRIFRGYSGWGPGQLEASSPPMPGWRSRPSADDLYGTDADALWRDVLKPPARPHGLAGELPERPVRELNRAAPPNRSASRNHA